MTPPRPARALSEGLSPPILLALVAATTALLTAATATDATVAALTAVLFGAVLPLAWITLGVRRGRLTDRHITRVRSQRHLPLAVSLTSIIAGAAVLRMLDAQPVASLFVVTAAVLLPCMVITVWWQVSIHCAVAAAVTAYAALIWSPWWATAAVIVVALAWARVAVSAHTLSQVAAGTALGVATGSITALLL
ncbi:hypothetical protein [Micromonospora haikouensis]|uniref:hypothetical protein n=1 Tax=Micromonospora haikouensis TaxID=686309 RepID=UPI003D703F87